MSSKKNATLYPILIKDRTNFPLHPKKRYCITETKDVITYY